MSLSLLQHSSVTVVLLWSVHFQGFVLSAALWCSDVCLFLKDNHLADV